MKYTATLQRSAYFSKVKQPKRGGYEDVTLGDLTLADEDGKVLFTCKTLENGGPSTDTPNQDKRIVARDYYLTWFNSTKNKSVAKRYPEFITNDGRSLAIQLHCAELPAFSKRYILIHSGCYAEDTEGCVLLGEFGDKGVIANSVMTCAGFMRALQKIGIENVMLRVLENPNEN